MKKIFILSLLLIVSLSSCGIEKDKSKEEDISNIHNNKNTEEVINTVEEEEKSVDNKQEVSNNEILSEEEEFNNSGSAKAINSEKDLWALYDNPEVGFSFQYPHDVILLEKNIKKDNKNTYISVDILDMGLGEGPMRLSKEDEMKNVEALTSGEFGIEQDFPLGVSKKVKSVGFLFAQDFIVLGRFEICDITLERKLIFYFNNKQITITLHGPTSEIGDNYLTINKDNCGDVFMWNIEKQENFYSSLTNGIEKENIQRWYNLFDEISETIIFDHR